MESIEQKLFVKSLGESRSLVLESNDRGEVIELIKNIIKQASSIPPVYSEHWNNKKYKDAARANAIQLLQMDLEGMENGSYYIWEIIHFQITTSILLLDVVYTDGGIDRVNEIIGEDL
jgi:hypothetical protein